jgi:hypothetical protein
MLVRHGGFWRRRQIEPDEKLLAALEAKDKPGLGEYATFAVALTPQQATAFFTLPLLATRFDQTPLRDAMPALRFYGSLTDQQKKSALAHPLPVSSLTALQRGLFWEALSSAPFCNADDESWRSGMFAAIPPDIANRMVFSVAAGRVWPGGKPLPGGLRRPGSEPRSPEDQKVDGAIFTFGVSPERRVAYTATAALLHQ